MNKNGSCIFSLTATHAPSLFLSLILILSLIFLPAEYVGGQVGVVLEEDPTQVTIQQPSELPSQQPNQRPANWPAKKNKYTIHEIPMPRPNGWVTDLTGTISPEAIEHINMVCQEINDRLGREMAVVVVPSIGEKSEPGPNSAHRKYATRLFNAWKIGKPGILGMSNVYGDNGVLLFVAIDDRASEIVLGDGIDQPEEKKIAGQINQNVVVKYFRDYDDPNSALYEGARAIGTRIFSVTDLDSPVMLPSVSKSGRKVINPNRKRRRQHGPITWLPFLAGGGLLGGLGLIAGGRYYMRYRPRHCPSCSDEMIRLEEDQDDVFLEEPERVEEYLGSVDYDIWGCAKCEEIIKLRYGKLFTRYSKCPKCWYITVLTVKDVLRRATYTRGGQVHVVEDCKNCNYHKSYVYRTPKKVKSSSGSSSFGGGGGGFSSGGGGFSGGSSSGGGSSGRW